jgi:hypothetical protein
MNIVRNIMTTVLAATLLGSTVAMAQPLEIRKAGAASTKHSKSAKAVRSSKKGMKKKSETKKAVTPSFPRQSGKLASRR